MVDRIETKSGRRLAYHQIKGRDAGPGVVFLGGFMSDMQGTKAVALENWARETGRAFLRFDYSGHGESDGAFLDGSIGDWAEDARHAISTLTNGKQILVGSSMGGWISAILAREIPEKIAGIVGIAAAPDFTEDSMWADFSPEQRAELMEKGQIYLPSDYDDPYPISRHLILDGRENLVLRSPLAMAFPVRLLQGAADRDVDMATALRLFEHITGPDVRLSIVKGADHRFSSSACLSLITESVVDILATLGLKNE